MSRFDNRYEADPNSGCWLWSGALDKYGYGKIWNGTKIGFEAAHRASYEDHVEPIPDGIFVCHHCDTRPCINPNHLFLGTHDDNMMDAVRKGRFSKNRHRDSYRRISPHERASIQSDLLNGASLLTTARKFKTSRSTVMRISKALKT